MGSLGPWRVRKDLKGRSLFWDPILLLRGTLKEPPKGIYFLDPSGGLGFGVPESSYGQHLVKALGFRVEGLGFRI